MKNLEEVVWAQEEPRNNGAWFVEPLIEESLIDAGHKGMRARYAGRAVAASPATGLMSRHQTGTGGALVADALFTSAPKSVATRIKPEPELAPANCINEHRSQSPDAG